MNTGNASQFSKRLAADEALAKVCREFAQEIHDAAREDAEIVARSRLLTNEDLAIVINPHVDDHPC